MTTKLNVSIFVTLIIHLVNSQISFDEFFLLHKKAFLYECQYNPNVIYQFDLDDIDEEDEEDRERMPETIIQTEEFYLES